MTTKGRTSFGHFPEYSDVILHLEPNAIFSIRFNDYSSLAWQSENVPVPTEDRIKEKLEELTNQYNSNIYKRQRFYSYPTIEDQLELLWNDMNSGKIPGKESSEWFKSIQEVKNAHLKPN